MFAEYFYAGSFLHFLFQLKHIASRGRGMQGSCVIIEGSRFKVFIQSVILDFLLYVFLHPVPISNLYIAVTIPILFSFLFDFDYGVVYL